MAGSSVIEKYAFALFLDANNFKKGARVAENVVTGLKRTLLTTYAAVGGIDFFRNMIKSYTSLSKTIGRMSEVTGEDIKTIEAWQISIRDSGGDVEAFNSTLKGLNEEMAQISNYGTSANLGTFQRLGLDIYNANGQLKKGSELLTDVAENLRLLDEREAFNFGKSMGIDEGTVILLRRYGSNIDSLIQKNKQFTAVRKEDVEISKRYEATINQFAQAWRQFIFQVAPHILKFIENEISPAFQNMLNYIVAHKGEIIEFFGDIKDFLVEILPIALQVGKAFIDIAKAVSSKSESFGGWLYDTLHKDEQERIEREMKRPYNPDMDRGSKDITRMSEAQKKALIEKNGGIIKSDVNIGSVTITTQATDAEGIAKGFHDKLSEINKKRGNGDLTYNGGGGQI